MDRNSSSDERRILLPVALLIACLICWAQPLRAGETPADWNQWRGPSRDGHVHGPAWPDNLSTETLRQVWRVELAPGYGGPLVADDRVFVVATEEERDEVVQALDRETGESLWTTRWPGAIVVPMIGRGQGNWIKSTPAWDGEKLYVLGMEDVMVALNGKSGAIEWRIDFKEHFETEQPEYGAPSSPLVYKDWVFIQAAGRLIRMNKTTGEVDWHGFFTGHAGELAPFSSPVIATIAGRRQLVAFFPKELGVIDPDTGEILWRIPVETAIGAAYPTPVIHNDHIFLSLYGRKTHMFRVSKDEDGGFTCEPVWENKAKGYLSTPVVVDGHAYLQLTNRRVICIDLETGEETWGARERFGLYWGMHANGDRILALDGEGTLRLLRANPEKMEILDTRKISETQAWAPIAFSGDEVYIRDIEGLTKYVWSAPATEQENQACQSMNCS